MMVRPIRAPLLLSLSLVAGTGFLLGAQAPARRARAEAGDSAERQLRRLERRADSLVRTYDDNELAAADRRAIGDSLDRTMVRIDSIARSLGMLPRRPRATLGMAFAPSMLEHAGKAVGRMFIGTRGDEALAPRGWLGIVVSGPAREPRVDNGEVVVRYLAHPVIVSVDPSSPAERAGLVPSDTLVAYDGRDVSENDISLTRLLRPNARVLVRVRREGRSKDVPVTIADVPSRIKMQTELSFVMRAPEAVAMLPEVARFSRMPAARLPATAMATVPAGALAPTAPLPPLGPTPGIIYSNGLNSVAGAQLYAITEGLARAVGVSSGLLVALAPVGSPAYQSGLRDGDVIVTARGDPIRTVGALRERVQTAAESGERAVELEIVRDKRPQKVTLRWSGAR